METTIFPSSRNAEIWINLSTFCYITLGICVRLDMYFGDELEVVDEVLDIAAEDVSHFLSNKLREPIHFNRSIE